VTRAEPVAKFRRWLVERLADSSWATVKGESLEELAERLWVHPDALRAAQEMLELRAKKNGRLPTRIDGKYDRPRQVELTTLPREVYDDWKAYCKARDLTTDVLLRSLVHHLLSRPAQPSVLSVWIYKGKRLKPCRDRNGATGRWSTSIVSRISHGAHQALVRRARNANVHMTAIVRGGIIDLLEGRIKQLHIIAHPRDMWGDPARYWTEV